MAVLAIAYTIVPGESDECLFEALKSSIVPRSIPPRFTVVSSLSQPTAGAATLITSRQLPSNVDSSVILPVSITTFQDSPTPPLLESTTTVSDLSTHSTATTGPYQSILSSSAESNQIPH